MEKKLKISAIVIAKNEEKKIEDCLESIKWCDEIILVDTGSTDKTNEIANKFGAKIYIFKKGSYNDWRNEGLQRAKGEWIMYVDADERVTPALKTEISLLIANHYTGGSAITFSAYAIPRRNIILGREMRFGGWWPDYVKRLFFKRDLKKWVGVLHEEPVFVGKLGHLLGPLIHLKHDNLSEMVDKTNKWSEIEAKLLYESHHPKMIWWRFFRIMFTELWYRMVVLRAYKDGPEGVIYAFYQMWSRFVTYAKLWEMQIKQNGQ